MKLQGKAPEEGSEGTVKLLPQEEECMWHVYNLMAPGDHVTATTFRKVQSTSSTGSSASQKVKLKLTIEVEDITFDPNTCQLRLKGKNTTENPHIRLGQYHTVELGLQRSFTLHKHRWDSVYLDRIDVACDPKRSAEVAAVVMQPGLAHVCLITTHMTIVRAKLDISIPRKRTGSSSAHDKALTRFFEALYEAISRHVDFQVVKALLIASPGFLREDFHRWLLAEATRRGDKNLLDNKSKMVLVHSSSGYKHALKEVLANEAVIARLNDTKAFGEVEALNRFFEMLNTDEDRAYYGYNHVKRANEDKAVEVLLLTDNLFRSKDIAERQRYVKLVEDVKANGGDVHIFSSLHVSGEQLSQLTGVAALLRFPLPEPEDLQVFSDSSDSE